MKSIQHINKTNRKYIYISEVSSPCNHVHRNLKAYTVHGLKINIKNNL